jgi:hypothetical protein
MILTVQNRFSEPFIGRYDGKEYTVVTTLVLPAVVARHLKKQSIIRDNPVVPSLNEFRLGIIEDGDDVSPLDALPQESMDRSDTDYPKSKIVPSGVRQGASAPRSGSGSTQVYTKERG